MVNRVCTQQVSLQVGDAQSQIRANKGCLVESCRCAVSFISTLYGNANIIILFMLKNAHYADIMLDAPTIALCPKLCPHKPSLLHSGRLRPGSKSLMIFMHSFQKLCLKTSTWDDFW